MDINEAKNKIDLIKSNISKVIVGKEDLIDKILVCLIADGHVLLEDLPGTGKTMLAKTLSVSVDSKFSRIQFTPDLLPADIVGLNIYDKAKESFKYVKGPIVTNILLADEINRATPRTQSALLEAMQERQFTVDGETRKLEDVFFVIATQKMRHAQKSPTPRKQIGRVTYPTFPNKSHTGRHTAKQGRKAKSLFIVPTNRLLNKKKPRTIIFMMDIISPHIS